MTDERTFAPSPRAALADVAERVVTDMPGVALTGDGSGQWDTAEHDHRVRGVSAVAQPDGRYELTLHVVVAWPPEPLRQLADELRRRVQAAAERERLESWLGAIDVDVVSVQEPIGEDRS